MADQTAIQWTDSTWNVVTGCTRVSPGCARCYIERTPPFRINGRRFARVGDEATTGVTLHWDRLGKVPRGPKVFTPSLGDLFHDDVPDEFIAEVFRTMERTEGRTFQVLTKRPERARDVLRWLYTCSWCDGSGCALCDEHDEVPVGMKSPLPNVWVGVSVENARYTWRANVLREIPAAVRFISAEPLLNSLFAIGDSQVERELLYERYGFAVGIRRDLTVNVGRAPLDLAGIDWVIIGGESGPGARPFHLEHARELIVAARMHGPDATASRPAVFVKQLGAVWAREHTRRCLECGPADAHGGDWDHWPPDLRVREFPRGGVLA